MGFPRLTWYLRRLGADLYWEAAAGRGWTTGRTAVGRCFGRLVVG